MDSQVGVAVHGTDPVFVLQLLGEAGREAPIHALNLHHLLRGEAVLGHMLGETAS